MKFISTRDVKDLKLATEAIVKGLSSSGGLYVPEKFPNIKSDFDKLRGLNYQELAFEIIKLFFGDIGDENIKECIKEAYEGRFEVKVSKGFLELYHGPTSAFKDAALLFLPQIMKKSKEILGINDKIVILTATSGDTGKAALEGFRDIDGISVVVFYPENGVSRVQELQMRTHDSFNSSVIAINGNFDDAQNAVKGIFADEEFKEEMLYEKIRFSSANSINIARLVPQIVYYFYGYFELLNQNEIANGEKINICVPTGNFGNILAGYYAKQMGLPIDKFICASNENNVLTDFINTGVYDRRRELILTESPSMDILVSSNLERLLFELSGRDDKKINIFMDELKTEGIYEIDLEMKSNMSDFYGYFANKEEVYSDIKNLFEKEKYLMDTHTAVAYNAYNKYVKDTGDTKKVLIASTASPFKFVKSIVDALELDSNVNDELELLSVLSENTGYEIPKGLKDLDKKYLLHNIKCDKYDIKNVISSLIKKV